MADSRHLQAGSLLALDLPLQDTQIFACGSQALLASLYQAVDELDKALPDNDESNNNHSLRDNIIIERFGTALPEQTLDALDKQFDLATHTVYLRSRQQQFNSDSTLLLSAEQAGILLNYSCRQGICQLCRCNKVSGVVKNIQTGKLSGDGYDSIQTCINVAMSDVVLDLWASAIIIKEPCFNAGIIYKYLFTTIAKQLEKPTKIQQLTSDTDRLKSSDLVC